MYIYLTEKEKNKRSRSLTTLENLENWILRKRNLKEDKKYEIIEDIRYLYRSICSEICEDSIDYMYYVPEFRKYLKSIDLNYFKSVVYSMDIYEEIEKSIYYCNNFIIDQDIFNKEKNYILNNVKNIDFNFTFGDIKDLKNCNDIREIRSFKLQNLIMEIIEENKNKNKKGA